MKKFFLANMKSLLILVCSLYLVSGGVTLTNEELTLTENDGSGPSSSNGSGALAVFNPSNILSTYKKAKEEKKQEQEEIRKIREDYEDQIRTEFQEPCN